MLALVIGVFLARSDADPARRPTPSAAMGSAYSYRSRRSGSAPRRSATPWTGCSPTCG